MNKFQSRIKKTFVAISCCVLLLVCFSVKPLAATNTNNSESVEDRLKNLKNNDVQEPPAAETNSETAAVSVSAWDYIKMVLALLFVLALLYGVLKLVNSKNRMYQQNQLMQNLGGLSLGQQKSVQLLQVGDSLFLVGVGEDISILKEITDTDEKEKMMTFYNEKQEFTAQVPYIANVLKRFKNPFLNETSKKQEKGNFEQMFKKRLSEIKADRSVGLSDWKKKENDRQ
ncbi:MAG: flagellar biosynthetic protein FliO [Paenisporosarcina sp.]